MIIFFKITNCNADMAIFVSGEVIQVNVGKHKTTNSNFNMFIRKEVWNSCILLYLVKFVGYSFFWYFYYSSPILVDLLNTNPGIHGTAILNTLPFISDIQHLHSKEYDKWSLISHDILIVSAQNMYGIMPLTT